MASVEAVVQRMRDLADKNGVPSNVSEMLEEACQYLEDDDKDLSVRVNSASSILDDISNDPNIKQHTRTEVWNLASKVESLND
ncbi:MAG: UPF0147 family protein [Candidatus Nanohaloarchaea archaeon]